MRMHVRATMPPAKCQTIIAAKRQQAIKAKRRTIRVGQVPSLLIVADLVVFLVSDDWFSWFVLVSVFVVVVVVVVVVACVVGFDISPPMWHLSHPTAKHSSPTAL